MATGHRACTVYGYADRTRHIAPDAAYSVKRLGTRLPCLRERQHRPERWTAALPNVPDHSRCRLMARLPEASPVDEAAEIRRYPPGLRHLARFVRLAENQGTRLVDVMERWMLAAEEHNRQAGRLADAAERLAQHADGYLGDPEQWEASDAE